MFLSALNHWLPTHRRNCHGSLPTWWLGSLCACAMSRLGGGDAGGVGGNGAVDGARWPLTAIHISKQTAGRLVDWQTATGKPLAPDVVCKMVKEMRHMLYAGIQVFVVVVWRDFVVIRGSTGFRLALDSGWWRVLYINIYIFIFYCLNGHSALLVYVCVCAFVVCLLQMPESVLVFANQQIIAMLNSWNFQINTSAYKILWIRNCRLKFLDFEMRRVARFKKTRLLKNIF